jgi:hypothetical protein
VRLKVGFKPLPSTGVHLIVFALVAFSRHLGLAMRQSEKPEEALVRFLRIFEEVFALEHEQLVAVEASPSRPQPVLLGLYSLTNS